MKIEIESSDFQMLKSCEILRDVVTPSKNSSLLLEKCDTKNILGLFLKNVKHKKLNVQTDRQRKEKSQSGTCIAFSVNPHSYHSRPGKLSEHSCLIKTLPRQRQNRLNREATHRQMENGSYRAARHS